METIDSRSDSKVLGCNARGDVGLELLRHRQASEVAAQAPGGGGGGGGGGEWVMLVTTNRLMQAERYVSRVMRHSSLLGDPHLESGASIPA